MANQIAVAFDIDQPAAAVEISTNSGTSWAALTVPTSGTHKTGNLLNVPAGTYGIGVLKLRAVGYPGSVVSNTAAVTVLSAPALSEILAMMRGDSTTRGQNYSTNDPYPAQEARALDPAVFTTYNLGQAGFTVQSLYASDQTAPYYDNTRFGHTLVNILMGINNCLNTTDTPQQIYDAIVLYVNREQSRGAQVLLGTLLPTTQGGTRGTNADVMACRDAVNALIVAGAQALTGRPAVRLDLIPQLADPTDTTIYPDGLHPDVLGNQYLAREFWRAAVAFLASVGVTVAPYSWDIDNIPGAGPLEVRTVALTAFDHCSMPGGNLHGEAGFLGKAHGADEFITSDQTPDSGYLRLVVNTLFNYWTIGINPDLSAGNAGTNQAAAFGLSNGQIQATGTWFGGAGAQTAATGDVCELLWGDDPSASSGSMLFIWKVNGTEIHRLTRQASGATFRVEVYTGGEVVIDNLQIASRSFV